MVTESMNINIDPGCNKAIDLETIPSHSVGPDFTMPLDGISGHYNLYDLDSSMTLGYQHGFMC